MSKSTFLFLFIVSVKFLSAQGIKCDSLFANYDSARIELKIDSIKIFITANMSPDSIRKKLKCYENTMQTAEENICGEQINFKNEKFSINIDQDYLEIQTGFSGLATIDVVNAGEEEMYAVAGDPERVNDVRNNDNDVPLSAYIYPKYYGTLAIWVNNATHKVMRVCMYSKKPNEIDLCVNY